MIVARMQKPDGTPLYVLGITAANVTELKKGHPIYVRKVTHPGVDVEIGIIYGDTLGDLRAELDSYIDERTQIIVVGSGGNDV